MSQERFPAASKRSSAKKTPSLEQIMTASPGKTPIQILHEYGTKIGKAPVYEQEKAEGQAHLPSFTFKVTVGDVSSTGQGHSKKAAKHKAAESVLNILKGDSTISLKLPEPIDPAAPKQQQQQNQCNPIGTLQEMAVKKGWRLPEYTLDQESGPPHKREFTMTCRLEKFVETGTGSSKKIAKRIAAETLVAKLQTLPPDYSEISTVNSVEKSSSYTWDSLRNSSGEHITSLKRNPLSIANSDYVRILEELAEEQNFSVTYLDIDELNVNGHYQCLAELSTNPVTVCHGSAMSVSGAHNDVAHNTLQYLKIMATRK